jgi:hypothetical protein
MPFLLFLSVGLLVHLLPTAEPRMVVPLLPIPLWVIGLAFCRRRPAQERTEAVGGPPRPLAATVGLG